MASAATTRNRSRRAGTIACGSSWAGHNPDVAARGRRAQLGAVGGAQGQASSGPSDPCGRTVLLSHVTSFDFSVIATLPTLVRPQIPEDTNADCHLWNGEQVPWSKYMCASLHFESTLSWRPGKTKYAIIQCILDITSTLIHINLPDWSLKSLVFDSLKRFKAFELCCGGSAFEGSIQSCRVRLDREGRCHHNNLLSGNVPHCPSAFSRSESWDRYLSVHSVLTFSDMEPNCPTPPGPAPPNLELPEAVRSRSHGFWTASGASLRDPARIWSTPTSVLFRISPLYPWTL